MASPRAKGEGVLKEIREGELLKEYIGQYERDKQWLDEHRAMLLEKYRESWVAVYGGEVIAHDRNLNNLVDMLRKKRVRASNAVIEYITDRKVTMLL